MTEQLTAQQILDREYLEIRAKLLEIAASLDRIQRAHGDTADDRRSHLIAQAIQVLADDEGNRAEKIQLLFSRQYEQDWRSRLGLNQ